MHFIYLSSYSAATEWMSWAEQAVYELYDQAALKVYVYNPATVEAAIVEAYRNHFRGYVDSSSQAPKPTFVGMQDQLVLSRIEAQGKMTGMIAYTPASDPESDLGVKAAYSLNVPVVAVSNPNPTPEDFKTAAEELLRMQLDRMKDTDDASTN